MTTSPTSRTHPETDPDTLADTDGSAEAADVDETHEVDTHGAGAGTEPTGADRTSGGAAGSDGGGATGDRGEAGGEVGEAAATSTAAAGAAARAVRTRALRADEVAALEEQRDFLLRSLDDLEQEHEAGDVDEHDLAALRDDYTARAARVIRALEAHEARVAAPRSPHSRWRTLATVAGVVVFALGAGLLVAQAAGRRQSGDTLTGNVRETTRQQVDDAVRTAAGGDYEAAIGELDGVIADHPDNVEAMTYKGWFQYRSGDSAGVTTLIDAIETNGDYPTAHAFMAVILRDLGRPDSALLELDRLDRLDPPAEVQQLVSGLREELEATTQGSTTTTTPPAG